MSGFAGVAELCAYGGFCALLTCVAVIDWRTCRIPNACVLALAALWAACAWAMPGGYVRGLVGAAAAGGFVLAATLVFERVRGGFALGGGDVKLVAALGLYLGAEGALAALAGGCIAFLAAQPLLRRRAATAVPAALAAGESAYPFGPFLAAGALAVLALGGS